MAATGGDSKATPLLDCASGGDTALPGPKAAVPTDCASPSGNEPAKGGSIGPGSGGGGVSRTALACLYLALFAQWAIMSMPSAFLPDSFVGVYISNTWQGLIFAAFPFGAMLTAPFVEPLMARMSKRGTVLGGLACMIVFMLAFGLVPFVISSQDHPTAAAVVYFVLALLYGSGSTLAELGAYTLLTQIGVERGSAGRYIALAETIIGLGVMFGAPLGGALYTAAGTSLGLSDEMRFFLPFVVVAVLPALDVVGVLVYLHLPPSHAHAAAAPRGDGSGAAEGPAGQGADGRGRPPQPQAGARHVLILMGLVLSAIAFGSARPTLEVRLDYLGQPEATLSSTTGLLFLVAGGLYMVTALPVGTLLDKGCCTQPAPANEGAGEAPRKLLCCLAVAPRSPALPGLLIVFGALVNAIALFVIGPLRLGDAVNLDVVDSFPWVVVSTGLSGVSICLMVVPSIPAMLVGFAPTDERAQGWATGLFGTFYALGTAMGPLVAGALMELQVPFLCRPGDWPANCTGRNGTATSTAAATAGGGGNHTGILQGKQHCFDGTSTLIGLALLAYAVVYGAFLCVAARKVQATAATGAAPAGERA